MTAIRTWCQMARPMARGEQQAWSEDREQQEMQQGVRQVWRRCAVLA
jgi:hypothetical protein